MYPSSSLEGCPWCSCVSHVGYKWTTLGCVVKYVVLRTQGHPKVGAPYGAICRGLVGAPCAQEGAYGLQDAIAQEAGPGILCVYLKGTLTLKLPMNMGMHQP